MASLEDDNFVQETKAKNERVKKYIHEQLTRLKLKSIESHSNFVYFSLSGYNNDYFERLKQHNIMGTRIYESDGKWTRITVGTMEEMQAFITAIS